MPDHKANKKLVQASKFLSLVLRHQPERIGVQLDGEGWVDVSTLLLACEKHGQPITPDLLEEIVQTSDKKRFVIRDGRIRANQGHSVAVDLALQPVKPPSHLFHGTADRFLEAIRREGLRKMQRQHVHLSPDAETAREVGIRHGRPAILRINAEGMYSADYEFFRSENGVWLTEFVPIEFIDELNGFLNNGGT
ncbi:MAG: RNA 2'-phosphotransferase [Planctomycetota bacterium]